MAGIINAASKGTYKNQSGQEWVYYQDLNTTSIFYIMPRPRIAQPQGYPQFHLTEYTNDQSQFVSALCQITTELAPAPNDIQAAIAGLLRNAGVADPVYQAMPFQDLGDDPDRNRAYLNYADAAGTVSRTIGVVPSLSGTESTIFNITNMTQAEVQFFKSYFGGNGQSGTISIVYQLTAVAFMGGIQSQVQFDAQAAYNYQRTYKWV